MQKRLFKFTAWWSLMEVAGCQLIFFFFAWYASSARGVLLPDLILSTTLMAVAFWWGFQWSTASLGTSVLQPAFVGTGMAFWAESVYAYSDIGWPLPLESLAAGCLGSACLLVGLNKWVFSKHSAGDKTLLLGYGAVGSTLMPALGSQLLGVLEDDAALVPGGVAYLGGASLLGEVVATQQPGHLVMDKANWKAHFPPRILLSDKLAGRTMELASSAYERLFRSVNVESYQPFHHWQEALRSNRRIMAVQAVYSNLSGLILLVSLSPVLVVLGLFTRLLAGPGAMFESVPCLGLQRMPFSRRSFRIRHAATGQLTLLGTAVSRLGLTNLPQLINLVRGEMALFGPAPVRREFAQYFEGLSPVYSHRFSMKPGIFGWAQAHVDAPGSASRAAGTPLASVQEESTRLGYDLYYLKHGSPFLDLQIFARSLGSITTAWRR